MRKKARSATVLTGAVLVALAGACSDSGNADAPPTSTAPLEAPTTTEVPLDAGQQVFVYTPEAGQCFDRRQLDERPATGPQQTDIVLLLDCALPHDNEVFDVLEMPDRPRDHPGETAMRDFARATCTMNFVAYVGQSYETSALEVGYYLPSSTEWESGARRLGCYLYAVDGEPLTGTMRGSGR